MTKNTKRLSGISGIIGVVILIISFNINPGPAQGASYEQLVAFGHQYYSSILWGAWLQLPWLAIGIGVFFGILGIAFLFHLVLPVWVTAIAGVQALWWLSSSVILVIRANRV